MDDYNTQKDPLILKEYGRNVQKLVNYLQGIDDREKRNLAAQALVDLMKQINPSVKDGNEDSQKLWDDLFIMSDFNLDIESPYPVPKKELLYKKPDRLNYNTKNIHYKHYGLNIQLMIEKAIEMEDKEEQESAIIYIGRLMKSFAGMWNKENLDDETILKNIKQMSKGLLDLDFEKVRDNNLFEPLVREKPRKSSNNQHHQKGGRRTRRKRG